jgi:predicted HicB family RNase H-like nuclease
MSDLMHYKGYYGSVHIDEDELIFYGKLEFIRGLITYEGNTARQLRSAFEEAVSEYLDTCTQRKIEAEIPFKGSLNVRLGKDLHRKIAIAANHQDISINSYIKLLLEKNVPGKGPGLKFPH